ncbi:MAG: CAP domain-containing protein, partial [Betaproteobacteria bacterium]|nr:CAP domain-containing protein [Betaproteobacteria bacterium]
TAAYISEVLILTNEARSRPQSCGAESFPPANALELSNSLTGAAIGHAEDMARLGYFSHSSQDGRQLADRVNATGYSWRTIGENIAKGQRSPKQVVAGWVNSPGHCKNIMNPNFKQIGIGRSGAYWVQVFGTTK